MEHEYAVVRHADDQIITDATDVEPEELLRVTVASMANNDVPLHRPPTTHAQILLRAANEQARDDCGTLRKRLRDARGIDAVM